MPELGLTTTLAPAIAIDYANKFNTQVRSLLQLLGQHDPIALRAGEVIKLYTTTVTLGAKQPAPGAIIPLSEVKREPAGEIVLDYDPKRKSVTFQDVQKYGFEQAIRRTDQALIREVQKGIKDGIIANLDKGTGVATGVGLQAALAQAWGQVQVAFPEDAIVSVAFVSPLDIADYLATAQISMQTAFGMSYLQNFLGVDVVFVNPAITKGTAYVTAAHNLNFVYADVSGELSKVANFVKDESGILGIAHDINLQRATSETLIMSGIAWYAEVLNGVVKTTITTAGV